MKRLVEVLIKSTVMTSLEKISVSLIESMCVRDSSDGLYGSNGRNGSDGLYACMSIMAKVVHMFVCFYGLCVLYGLGGAIQPLGVSMYSLYMGKLK